MRPAADFTSRGSKVTAGTLIDVRLKAIWVEQAGYRYDVIFDGETIVSGSRDPEYDAARVLRDRGLRGTFRTVDFVTGKPRMILKIEKAALLRTLERVDGGSPVVVAFQPMSEADKIRVFTHRLHQGRVFPEWTGEGTVEAIAAAGRCASGSGGQRLQLGGPGAAPAAAQLVGAVTSFGTKWP